MEVLLVHQVAPDILFEAIKIVYADAGHPFEPDNWRKALRKVDDTGLRALLPPAFAPDLLTLGLSSLGDERTQRAFLFACLHGPHECKAAKDMRMIAEYLAEQSALPELLDALRLRILSTLKTPSTIAPNDHYLQFDNDS